MTTIKPRDGRYTEYRPTLPKAAEHDEAHVKAELREVLAADFAVREEVVGASWDSTKVKLDFWCYPKPDAVAKGWPAEWFGIEAKGWGIQDQRKKTCAHLLYQAIRYRDSTFPTPGGPARPFLMLVTPPFLTILRDRTHGDDSYAPDDFPTGFAFGLAKLGAMFRVGELQLNDDGGFDVYFHGINCWWRHGVGRTGMDCLGKEDPHASR